MDTTFLTTALVSRAATPTMTPFEQGRLAAIEGQPLQDMTCEEMAAGWWSAHKTQGEADRERAVREYNDAWAKANGRKLLR